MSVDLSKCKVGDVLFRRDGEETELVRIYLSYSYPFITRDGQSHCKNGMVWRLRGECGYDIVAIAPTPKRRVAKCYITSNSLSEYWWQGKVESADVSCRKEYSRKRDAIRGAKRFCKSIGYECVIEEYK